MRVSLVSMNQAWEDKERNILYCRAALIKAKNHQADLVIFPEMTLTGFSMNFSGIGEVYAQSKSIKYFKELSEEFRITIRPLITLFILALQLSCWETIARFIHLACRAKIRFLMAERLFALLNFKEQKLGPQFATILDFKSFIAPYRRIAL